MFTFYHTQNSGVERRIIFEDEKDCNRFLDTLIHYTPTTPSSRFAFRKRSKKEHENSDLSPLVDIIAYCLMPNHFHLLLKENVPGGVSVYLSRVSNSYTKYFNARHKRSGALFKGRFKSAKIENEQLPDIARYIHLDPFSKKIVRDINKFPFSSYFEISKASPKICKSEPLLAFFPDINSFLGFTNNFEEYSLSLERIKKITLD